MWTAQRWELQRHNLRIMAENGSTAGTRSTFPCCHHESQSDDRMDTTFVDNHVGTTEDLPHADKDVPKNTATTEDAPRDSYEESVTVAEPLTIANTPMPTSPIECSTERTMRRGVRDSTGTPSGPTKRKGDKNLGVDGKEKKNFMKFEEPIIRRSDRIKTAKRVEKIGRREYFYSKVVRFENEPQRHPRSSASPGRGHTQPKMHNIVILHMEENTAGSHESVEGE